jgi:hypothetical protein
MPPSTEALQDVVNLAAALGLGPPPRGGRDASSSGRGGAHIQPQQLSLAQGKQISGAAAPVAGLDTEALLEAADAAHTLTDRHLASLAAARRGTAGPFGDAARMSAAADTAAAHAAAARTIVASKHVVADRLRAAKLRPAVPVEPSAQPDFDALLQQGAAGRPLLDHGGVALRWAAALEAPPSCWEDTLRGIPEGARACRQHLAAVARFGAALEREAAAASAPGSGGADAAAVAGGACAGGGGSAGSRVAKQGPVAASSAQRGIAV